MNKKYITTCCSKVVNYSELAANHGMCNECMNKLLKEKEIK